MVVVHKLTRNGNASMVTIPLAFIKALSWSCGQRVALELCLEDGTIWVRQPSLRDLRSTAVRPRASAPVEAAK